MDDAKRQLTALREEWEGCTQCELGVRREQVNGSFVFGEGHRRGVMFIGEGPGVHEEADGRPFVGQSGQLLRNTIKAVGLDRYYITNVVTCRSCEQDYDNEGQPRFRRNRRTGLDEPDIKDKRPTTDQMKTCIPRLYREMYLVDPLLVVGVGGESSQMLMKGKAVKVTRESGVERHIQIPGVSFNPDLTAKKKVWARKIKGVVRRPVIQNMVTYLMIPILHPAYALKFESDERHGAPLPVFVQNMEKIVEIYRRLTNELYDDYHPEPLEYLYP